MNLDFINKNKSRYQWMVKCIWQPSRVDFVPEMELSTLAGKSKSQILRSGIMEIFLWISVSL